MRKEIQKEDSVSARMETIGNESAVGSEKEKCGIVMPISAIESCTGEHWADVLSILSDAIADAGYEPNLVSNAAASAIIHKTIIENLYLNPVVVCDISCKNPNVMLELGMRLAFDKPVIIVKDSETPYSFDTSPIEHLTYPRDLRFSKIVDFKENLSSKIKETIKASTNDPNYSPFLKSFGSFKVAAIETQEVPGIELILEKINSIHEQILRGNERTFEPFQRAQSQSVINRRLGYIAQSGRKLVGSLSELDDVHICEFVGATENLLMLKLVLEAETPSINLGTYVKELNLPYDVQIDVAYRNQPSKSGQIKVASRIDSGEKKPIY